MILGQITAKLKSRRGASVVIALIFFTLCITLSAILLNAVDISVRLLPDTVTERQDYLTLSSAAELVRTQLLELNGVITQTEGVSHANESCPGYTGESAFGIGDRIASSKQLVQGATAIYSNDTTLGGATSENGELFGIQAVVLKLLEDVLTFHKEQTQTITLTSDDASFVHVAAEFTLADDEKRMLTVKLGFADSDARPIVLTFEASSVTDETTTATTSHGDFSNATGEPQTCEVTLTVHTISVRWDSCILTKGQ